MKETDLAYAAGLFDGEGCVSCNWNDHTSPTAIVMIVNLHEGCLKWCHERFGGNLCTRENGIFQWAISNKEEIRVFLSAVLPYLQIKEEVAAWAIVLAEMPHGNSLDKEGKAKRDLIAQTIHSLNRHRTGKRGSK